MNENSAEDVNPDDFKDCEEHEDYYGEFVDQPEADDNDFEQNGNNVNGQTVQQKATDQATLPSNDLNMMEVPDEKQLTNNDCILSQEISVGHHSFINFQESYKKVAPPPKYFTANQIIQFFGSLPVEYSEILYGFDFPKERGGLICTDEEALNKQRGVLSHVVKQLAVSLLRGQSISHISLPIKIFEPRSSIQRMCDLWSFAPIFLKQAARETDPLERLKLVIAFGVSSIYLCCGQNKPFNPLLGETFQGKFPDGTKIFCEHVSHHPPITNFLIEDVDGMYTLSGYYEVAGKINMTNFVSGLRGPNNLVFKDGHHIRFGFPSYKLGGVVHGDRTVEAIGSCTYEDLTHNRKAVIVMNTYISSGLFSSRKGSKDILVGIIYDTKHPLTGDMKSIKELYSSECVFVDQTELKHMKDQKKKLCDISGSWLKNLVIDGKEYWNVEHDVPNRQIPLIDRDDVDDKMPVLSSDWRYREDLIWLQYGYTLIAHQWKLRLEVQQRHDRAQRTKGEKKRNKKKK